MSWVVKYSCEFTDILGLDWLVNIEQDASAFDSTMQASGNALNIEFLSSSDSYMGDPVCGSRADLAVESLTNFQYLDLYSTEDRKFRMSVYHGATLYWRGYNITDNYSEPYDGPTYSVTISASDGLGVLKDIIFAESVSVTDGVETITYYNGRTLESKILIDILAKIGYTQFTEYVNIYEDSMDDSVDDSPMDQLCIDVDLFKDMNCHEVLSEILKKYNAVIRQVNGEMVIYRPVELSGATVYGRVFTSASAKTSTTFSPDQFFSKKGAVTDLRDVNGGTLMIQRPAKKISIRQNYGYKDSWLDNWQLKGITNHAGAFDYWSPAGGAEAIGNVIPGESDGAGFQAVVNEPPNVYYLWQLFGTHSVTDAKSYNLEFDYIFYNTSGAVISGVSIWLEIKSLTNGHYLYTYDENELRWDHAQNYVTLTTDAPVGNSGWGTFKRTLFQGLQESGQYGITLLGLHSPGSLSVTLGIKNVKFYAVSDELTIKKVPATGERFFWWIFKGTRVKAHEERSVKDVQEIVTHDYIKTNSIKGIDLNFDYILGDVLNTSTPASDADTNIDNIIEQFSGALATVWSLAKAIATFITDHAADYNPAGTGNVILSQGTGANTNDLILTAETAGHNFTGSTTITNTSGDLTGSVVATRANGAGVPQIDFIDLVGTSGTGDITINELTRGATWQGTAAATWDKFVTDWAADYDAVGVTITRSTPLFTDNLKCLEKTANGGFTDITSIVATSVPGLSGTVNQDALPAHQDPVAPIARIDTITLSGTGTANILCDGVTQEISTDLLPSSVWNTRGGAEAKPLLEIIGDEIAEQRSRPIQSLQIPVMEDKTISNTPHVNLLGNFQDSLNQVSGNNRKFVFNSGLLNVRDRLWDNDLIEII